MKRAPSGYEDLIFENRNKQYGAYELRVNYQANLMKSFFIGVGGLTLLAFIIFKIASQSKVPTQVHMQTTKFDLTKTFVIEPENKIENTATKNISKPATVAMSKAVVDPNAFHIVKKIIEPATPIIPNPPAIPIEPIVGSLPGTIQPVLPTSQLPGGSGPDLGSAVLTSAAVDKLPMFPGGMEGFYNFLSKHMRFPDEARKEGISGKLFVSFVINKEGNLVEIEFVKKAGFGMEESVMAVLENSPKWAPGQVGNQQVNTKMILPVTFNLVQ